MNVYEHCPEIAGARFVLRLVTEEDCQDLLKVYSDEASVPLFNSDNCNGDDFHYTTMERMLQGIRMWLWSYHHGWFVRWSIVDKAARCTVGTIELFRRDEEGGVLRLDLRSDYENAADILEILSMILPPSFDWFGCGQFLTKAKPIAGERLKALRKLGFQPSEKPLIGHDGTVYGDYYSIQERDALFTLAMLHIYGDGVAEDNALAVTLLARARELGSVEAAYNLGICYHYGYGTAVDLARAYNLYLESANGGYGKGMELVGRFFHQGIYVEKDQKKAEFWLGKAMESGDPEAEVEARRELGI